MDTETENVMAAFAELKEEAFAELKEASEMIGKEYPILLHANQGLCEFATLTVTSVSIEIRSVEAGLINNWEVKVDYEIRVWETERPTSLHPFCAGTRDYESIKRMIGRDGK